MLPITYAHGDRQQRNGKIEKSAQDCVHAMILTHYRATVARSGVPHLLSMPAHCLPSGRFYHPFAVSMTSGINLQSIPYRLE